MNPEGLQPFQQAIDGLESSAHALTQHLQSIPLVYWTMVSSEEEPSSIESIVAHLVDMEHHAQCQLHVLSCDWTWTTLHESRSRYSPQEPSLALKRFLADRQTSLHHLKHRNMVSFRDSQYSCFCQFLLDWFAHDQHHLCQLLRIQWKLLAKRAWGP
ncbi:MAG: hypothetical protein MI717_15365 [Spirochaetales bacterium]|nr:hypothetical protein [Spirochaetales bacterium]